MFKIIIGVLVFDKIPTILLSGKMCSIFLRRFTNIIFKDLKKIKKMYDLSIFNTF